MSQPSARAGYAGLSSYALLRSLPLDFRFQPVHRSCALVDAGLRNLRGFSPRHESLPPAIRVAALRPADHPP